MVLFNPKLEGGDKRVHTFSKDRKVNVEFELVNYNDTIQHFSHYSTGTPPELWMVNLDWYCTCTILCFAKNCRSKSINTSLIFFQVGIDLSRDQHSTYHPLPNYKAEKILKPKI